MAARKLTPILFVEKIEPVIPFWAGSLGFQKTVEVPEGNRLGFIIFQQGNVEVMYQSLASVEKDLPAVAPDVRKGPTFLYLEVNDLEAIKIAMRGAREIGVRDPAGHFITFAQMAAAAA